MQVLESEVCFHNTSSFDSGPQHILLGGHISAVGYPVQVIQVALGREKSARDKQRERWTPSKDIKTEVENESLSAKYSPTLLPVCVSVCVNSLCSGVVELVLSGAAEAGLNSSVLPQPLDDPG